MNGTGADQRAAAMRARDRIAASFLRHPGVSLIDIGTEAIPGSPDARRFVVRVHVRPTATALPAIPDEVDGIPVRVIRGDYQLDQW